VLIQQENKNNYMSERMKPIRLLYAKNIISHDMQAFVQELAFAILVKSFAYQKQVDLHWAGADGPWWVLKAEYHCSVGKDLEIWRAKIAYRSSSGKSLPRDVQFAFCYRVLGKEYWDNNHGRNYWIRADSGLLVNSEFHVINFEPSYLLQRGQKSYQIAAAVQQLDNISGVHITWSTDGWKSHYRTPCWFAADYWRRTFKSNAGNPNPNGCGIWSCRLDIGDAYQIEYAISCDKGKRKLWDNNFGKNYLARRERLKVLTLNLHCYQEELQDRKFALIAKAVSDLSIDVVCLQEVGELWNDGKGDWPSNAARIIREHLRRSYHLRYHLYTDWSHIGFARYREGSAVSSKFKFLSRNSKYVSTSRDIYDIHARKVIMVQIHVPYMGLINVFSAHLSWWHSGFHEQFTSLRRWVNELHTDGAVATLLCGDFNNKAGSDGYKTIVNSGEFEDQFLLANSNFSPGLVENNRIDYIFLRRGSLLRVASARVLFTDHDYGRVSDHCGYYAEFEPQ
jgi:maltose 6'-phosphate phosphatase